MITLKEALTLASDDIEKLRNDLNQKIKEAEKTETKKQFNKMIFEWIDGLGKVEICKTCNEKNDKKNFLKNFDLNWTDDENIFTKNVIEKLNKYDVKVKILTGDNPYSTKSVYLLAVINSEKIYLGSDIDKLSDKSLSKVVEKVDVFASFFQD